MNRFGFFGGSFDPIHRGHAALADAALKELKLHKLFVVPAALSPHKQSRPPTSARHRVAMVRRVFRGQRRCVIHLDEIGRGGVSYTFRTLSRLVRRYPKAEWFLILGEDAIGDFQRWHRWRDILALARLVIGRRRGGKLPAALRPSIVYLRTRLPTVASRDIRKSLKHGSLPRRLLPPAVTKYIAAHRLYV